MAQLTQKACVLTLSDLTALQDLTLAVQELVRLAAAGQLRPEDVTPDAIAAQLATRQLPAAWREPDLVIRTSGEQRLSNFMCWEAAYSGGRRGGGVEQLLVPAA